MQGFDKMLRYAEGSPCCIVRIFKSVLYDTTTLTFFILTIVRDGPILWTCCTILTLPGLRWVRVSLQNKILEFRLLLCTKVKPWPRLSYSGQGSTLVESRRMTWKILFQRDTLRWVGGATNHDSVRIIKSV